MPLLPTTAQEGMRAGRGRGRGRVEGREWRIDGS
jgi:hypothetical protein